MSEFDPKGSGLSRRHVTIGGGIAVALGLAALGVTAPRLFGTHYAKTPYDDLLTLLVDRDAAATVGKAAAGAKAPELAKALRGRIGNRPLAAVSHDDIAGGRLAEVKGWVLPETLVGLCLLAAEAG